MRTFKHPPKEELRCACTHSWNMDFDLYSKLMYFPGNKTCPICHFTMWIIKDGIRH